MTYTQDDLQKDTVSAKDRSVFDVFSSTPIERATKLVSEAVNRMHRLEHETNMTFKYWLEAQAVAEEAGLVVDIKLSTGMSAHLSEYKRTGEREAAKAIVDEEFNRKV